MVGSSKILTVSYGTFSCTLEGFDDSFSTMKAIAEYFRDLAADDRYFGAEPPTPDAEMLARIAEREIARRVEARTDGTGIVLKAGQALSAPEAPVAAEEPEAAEPVAASQPASEMDEADQLPEMAEADTDDTVEVAETDDHAEADEEIEAPTDTAPEAVEAVEAVEATTSEDYSPDSPENVAENVAQDVADASVDTAAEIADDLAEDVAEDVTGELAGAEDVLSEDDSPAETGDADDIDATDPSDYEAAASKLAESLAARPTPHRVAPTRVMPPHHEAPEEEARSEDAIDLPPVLTAPPAHPDPDSVAAKLERIRAVVGRSAQQDVETENEHALDPVSPASTQSFEDDQPDDAETSQTEDETADVQDGPVAAAEEAHDEDDDRSDASRRHAPRPVRTRVIKMSLAEFRKTIGSGDIAPVAEEPAQTDALEADEAPEFEDLAAASEMTDADAHEMSEEVDDLSEDDYDDISDEDIADLAALDGTTPEDVIEAGFAPEAALLSDEEEAELLAELAELERSDDIEMGTELPTAGLVEMSTEVDAVAPNEDDLIEDAVATDEADPVEDDVASDEPEAVEVAGGLDTIEDTTPAQTISQSPEDDATRDVMAAWEMADEDDEDDTLNLFGGEDEGDNEDETADRAILSDDDEDDDDEDRASDPRALRRQRAFESNPDEDNEVLSRLIEHTDDQLNDPDINRRRESITQLKAAVAAKEAARQMGEQDSMSDETADKFRNDLRQAVRPRRPARVSDRPTTRTERPQTAPLKLVASQRVDLNPDEQLAAKRPAAPVRPRRVRLDEASEAEAARDAGSFEVFARDMGAQGLAELLEAAAAYTAYVEGSEDFSRPQLMSKVRGLADRDFSREEGLRSFGTLLREGRIMKVRNGRFQVSEETRFHPERRAG